MWSSLRSLVLLLAVMSLPACAANCAAQAWNETIETGAEASVYDVRLAELRPHIMSLIADHGGVVAKADIDVGVTIPVDTGHFNRTYQIRVDEAQVGLIVRINGVSRDPGDGGTGHAWRERETELEWELLERADPDRAASIRALAEERARGAYQTATEAGCAG